VIDPAAIGRSLRVLVGVRIVRHARTAVVAFERAVVKLPEVRYAHHVAGNYDYILQVEVADLPAHENFHANRLASLLSGCRSHQLRDDEDPPLRHHLISDAAKPPGGIRLGRWA
jgi:DNA-binding Lrp family transcriptional regulator